MPISNTKKKILFFVGAGVGGAERMTVRIGRFLRTDEFEPTIVIVGRNTGNIVNYIPNDIKTIHLKVCNIYDFTTCRIISLLKKEKPYAVFSSSMYLNIRVIAAAHHIGGIKIVVRSENTLFAVSKLTRYLVNKTYKYADHIIAQQDEMKEEIHTLLNIPNDKISALPNPIDTEYIDTNLNVASPYKNHEHINYVWVARFDYTKGQDVLLKAFHKVYNANVSSHLYFVGGYNEDSDYFKDIKEYIDQNKLSDNVHFVGFDKNPYRWVKYCDCFVQPSRLEGLPNALIEAMYLQKPVVASLCIPVIGRIVKDGYNGYIVPSEDIQGMSEAMIKAISLKKIEMTYKPASQHDFINLFKN